jgi:hypothetical protein
MVLAAKVETSNKLFKVNVLNVPVEANTLLTNRLLPYKLDTWSVLVVTVLVNKLLVTIAFVATDEMTVVLIDKVSAKILLA